MLKLNPILHNLFCGQHFRKLKPYIRLPQGYEDDSEQCSNRLNSMLIFVNFSRGLAYIMIIYYFQESRQVFNRFQLVTFGQL